MDRRYQRFRCREDSGVQVNNRSTVGLDWRNCERDSGYQKLGKSSQLQAFFSLLRGWKRRELPRELSADRLGTYLDSWVV